MVKAQKYILVKRFQGVPKPSDLRIVEEELPALKDGQFLAEAIYLSLDPYQRAYSINIPIGSTFIGGQVAKIIESKNSKFPVGAYVVGEYGWRTYTIDDGSPGQNGWPGAWIVPDLEGHPLSLSLGALGMPGITALFGFLELCQPKPGETVIVTGAAGAVGSLVGQIAKIKGCRVIGVAGSDEKGKWLLDGLKFDSFLNYKDKNFAKKLREAAPDGIDCYFDNVGGEISTKILNRMNLFGRVSVCGAISGYNNREDAKAGAVQFALVGRQLKMEGFTFMRWLDKWYEGLEQLKIWIKENKLQYRETVTEGFDNMFQAFADMLDGKNYGKAIVKVTPDASLSPIKSFVKSKL